MALGFGLLSAQLTPGDPRTWEDLYLETLDLSAHLDAAGYDSVWTTEHHFVDDGSQITLSLADAIARSLQFTESQQIVYDIPQSLDMPADDRYKLACFVSVFKCPAFESLHVAFDQSQRSLELV